MRYKTMALLLLRTEAERRNEIRTRS